MNHLHDVEMTWWSQGKGAWRMSLKLFLLSLPALVHGIFPSILVHSVSDKIKVMAEVFQQEALQRNPH